MTAALLDTKVNNNDLKTFTKDKKTNTNEEDKDFFAQIIESLEDQIQKNTSKNSLVEKLLNISTGDVDLLKENEDLQKFIEFFSKVNIDYDHDLPVIGDTKKDNIKDPKSKNDQNNLLVDLYKLSYIIKDNDMDFDFKNSKISNDFIETLSNINTNNNLKNVKDIKELFKFAEKNNIKIKNFEFFKEDTLREMDKSFFDKDVQSEDILKMIEKKLSNSADFMLKSLKDNNSQENTLKNILSNIKIKDKKIANNKINSKKDITNKDITNIVLSSKDDLSEKNSIKENSIVTVTKNNIQKKSISKNKNSIDLKVDKSNLKVQKDLQRDQDYKNNKIQNEIFDKNKNISNNRQEEKLSINQNEKNKIILNEQKKTTTTVKKLYQTSVQRLKEDLNTQEKNIKSKSINVEKNKSQNHIYTKKDENDINLVNKKQLEDIKNTKFNKTKTKTRTKKTLQTVKHTQEVNILDSKSDVSKKYKSIIKNNSDDNNENFHNHDHIKNESANNIQNIKVDHTKQKNQDVKHTLNTFAQDFKEQVESYKPPLMKVKMQLNPKGLGDVDVTMINRGNNLHITVNSNPNTIAIFTQNQVEFKNSLVNMGFSELNMSFNENGQNKNNDQQHKNKNNSNKNFEEEQLQDSFEITTPIYI